MVNWVVICATFCFGLWVDGYLGEPSIADMDSVAIPVFTLVLSTVSVLLGAVLITQVHCHLMRPYLHDYLSSIRAA